MKWLVLLLPAAAIAAGSVPASAEAVGMAEVPPITAAAPYDGFVVNASDEARANLKRLRVTAGEKPAAGTTLSLWGWARCEWVMPTPDAGDYVVSLHLVSGDKRPGKFGYRAGEEERVSDEFWEKGSFEGCLKAFRITVPAGQKETRCFLTGDGLYVGRVDISRWTLGSAAPDGRLRELAPSSYRTVIRSASGSGAPACVVLVPEAGPGREAARALATRLGIPARPEHGPGGPFPSYPIAGLSPATNLIVVSAGEGGPLAAALRRADLLDADASIPGAGGYQIRTPARPFDGTANVVTIAASDAAGLKRGVEAFAPTTDPATKDLVYDAFLVEVPGERWAALRPSSYARESDAWFEAQTKRLERPLAGLTGSAPARSYIGRTADWGTRYWLTGDPRFADLFKRWVLKMEADNIYGGSEGKDSHMALYLLMRAWDRCEEAPVFTPEERLRITNYLLLRCVEGNEGFARSYSGYNQYSGSVRMRHNHQTILGCGLMEAYLYYARLYHLGRAAMWKGWCDDLIANATLWGHAPEDSINYEPGTFMEVAHMLHAQGLSTKGIPGTEAWPATALRFLAARDSFSLPACYGDCWDVADWGRMKFVEVLRDDWGWPGAQASLDRLIRGYRVVHPTSEPAGERYAYLHGSTEVGGVREPAEPGAAAAALRPLLGLAALPMTEGFYTYQSGRVGNADFWAKQPLPQCPPYAATADKVQYRSGFGIDDEYLLLETLGWANHGHMDLGTLVQYCQGGRLWIVDAGYENTDTRHHSTLEVARDGKPAWAKHPGVTTRWGDFRTDPQMFEIVEREPKDAGTPGPFRVKLRARNLAGATWVRTVSGGDGAGLRVEDALTADEPGEYEIAFRLRFLGAPEGEAGRWTVAQKGAALPVSLEVSEGDRVGLRPWEPDAHTFSEGRYPWYPYITGGGRPATLEWTRKVRLERGQTTLFRARLGPSKEGNAE